MDSRLDQSGYAIPDVSGMAVREASDMLADEGFTPRPLVRFSARAASWSVVRTEPAAGVVASAGTDVDLVVVGTPRPGVSGASRQEGETDRDRAASVRADATNASGPEEVGRQQAADEGGLDEGVVPDVVGLDVNSALDILFGLGYTITFQFHADEVIAADHVNATHPGAGHLLAPGLTVLVSVSTGPGGTVVTTPPWPPEVLQE
jgi:beta-lactam-binding protein with PASTA domain